jgi:predicted PurR-regulated permease PerM
MKTRRFNPVQIGFSLFILGVLVLGVMFYSKVLSYVVPSMILAYLLNPLVGWLEGRGLPRIVSILGIYTLVAGVLLLAVVFVIPLLLDQVNQIAGIVSTGEFIDNLQKIPFFVKTNDFMLKVMDELKIDVKNFNKGMMSQYEKLILDLPRHVVDYLLQFLTILSYLAAVPIITFFLVKDQAKFKQGFYRAIPNRYYELVVLLVERIDELTGTFLRALMIEVVVISVLAGIVLTILQVPYGLVIAVIAGFANAIPYFGPLIGMICAVSTVLMTGMPASTLFYVVIGMMAIQSIDNNFIYPFVVGNKTEMHPLVVMLTVLAGGLFAGILGMFFAVPLVFLARGILQVLYTNLRQYDLL